MKSKGSGSYSNFTRKFEQAKKDAKEFIIPLDDRVFRRQPSADAWSIGECFSHLIETGTLYYKEIKEGTEDAEKSERAPDNPMHLRFHMQWFVNFMAPPVSFKTKTPGPFQPIQYANLDKEETLSNYLNLQDQYLEQLKLAETNNLDLSDIKVSNPIIKFIKMTVAECIAVTEAHQRRHLLQAGETLKLVTGQS